MEVHRFTYPPTNLYIYIQDSDKTNYYNEDKQTIFPVQHAP